MIESLNNNSCIMSAAWMPISAKERDGCVLKIRLAEVHNAEMGYFRGKGVGLAV